MTTTPEMKSDGVATSLSAPAPAQAAAAETTALGTAPAPQAKPAETPPAAGEAPKTQPEGPPETYADFAVPEGAAAFDKDVVAAFGTVAKELKLSQGNAQKLLDSMAPAIAKSQQARVEALKAEWQQQVLDDPVLGGDRLGETMAIARKAYGKFASPELRKMLTETGLEGHREVIAMFHSIGKVISDDTIVAPGSSGPSAGNNLHDPARQAKTLYS